MTPSSETLQIRVPPLHSIGRRYRMGSSSQLKAGPGEENPEDVDTVGLDQPDVSDLPTSTLELARRSPSTAELAERLPQTGRSAVSPAPAETTSVTTGASQAKTSFEITQPKEIGPGTVLRGRYLIEKAIGAGGTSTVFTALDRHRVNNLGAFGRIAVKVLRLEEKNNDARIFRMEREFRQMQKLTHAGIVRVFDLDCEDGLWFITMEQLEGEPLHRYLKAGLKDAEAFRILTQCAEALAYAHDHGIVHGDLKPSNVFVTRDGSIRLIDFGSAPDLSEADDAPAPHRFAATPPYASPQVLEGRGVTTSDDIFSLGCLAYELLTGGKHPFDRKSSADARQQNLRPVYVRSIRPRHFMVITKALAWEREARPAGAREFLHAFLAADFTREPVAQVESEPISIVDRFCEPSPPAVQSPPQPTDAAANTASNTTAPQVEVAAESPPANDDIDFEWLTPSTQDVPPQPAEVVNADSESLREFAGFVPPELLPQVEGIRTTEAPAPDLRVDGLSEPHPRVRRTMLIALVIAAVLLGVFLVGYLHTETAPPLSTTPPVVSKPVDENQSVAPAAAPSVPAAESQPEPAPAAATKPVVAPSAPGVISLETATVNVGSSQSMAVINVTRLKSTKGATQVAWSTIGGTARPGIHYQSFDSQIARFHDGQSVRSLFIPLKYDATETSSRPTRSFVVQLEKAQNGPALGAITQARVIIEGVEE